ncbi:MAG TPA: TIGR00269 family protein, partial [Actinomycetota bacterium]|nr:TIGR00269 family protein [Actinomycetota bacterium]
MKVRLRNPDREVEVTGGRKVKEVLAELAIDPDTVLVIKDRTLLMREERVEEDERIEIRPVISGGAGPRPHTKCRRCRQPAVIELRRHNAAFCQPCFLRYFQGQVTRAIEDFDMFGPGDRVLVAVSGGKDSLALWDVLLELGYRATGMYLGLGIGDYSDRSGEAAHRFAEGRSADLLHVELRDQYGFDIPTAGKRGSRSTCSVCGLSKRYIFNRVALDHRFDVVATGHNLDDEAATLLGNTLRWQTEYMARQYPRLSGREGLVKKVKPLHRLSERETAAYAFLHGIDYVVEECPLVAGNTQLKYKDALNHLEGGSPGVKASFYLGYLDRAADRFRDEAAGEGDLVACERCGQPTTGRFCAFCRARAQVTGERLSPPADDQLSREL